MELKVAFLRTWVRYSRLNSILSELKDKQKNTKTYDFCQNIGLYYCGRVCVFCVTGAVLDKNERKAVFLLRFL